MPSFQPAWRAFGQKLSNDWIFNLSGLLAFNLLLATFPFLLMLFALLGITFGLLSPTLEHQIIHNISAVFPSSTGTTIVRTAADNLTRNAGLLLVLGIITAIFMGSRMFIVIENCFGIIFRVPSRKLMRQNLVAVGMVAIFMVLVPLFLILSLLPGALLAILHPSDYKNAASAFMQVVVFVGTVGVAAVIFGLIYYIVPNRPIHWRSTWPGTVIAAVLLVLYEKLFPWYVGTFLRPNNYSSIAGFVLVILIFYNFLAFILLLGAEINSWIAGKRATAGDLQAILAEVDKHQEALRKVVPAAIHPPEKMDNEPDHEIAPTARIRRPISPPAQEQRAFHPAMKTQRQGRASITEQLATIGILAVSVLSHLMQRREKKRDQPRSR
jgi:membrane protein